MKENAFGEIPALSLYESTGLSGVASSYRPSLPRAKDFLLLWPNQSHKLFRIPAHLWGIVPPGSHQSNPDEAVSDHRSFSAYRTESLQPSRCPWPPHGGIHPKQAHKHKHTKQQNRRLFAQLRVGSLCSSPVANQNTLIRKFRNKYIVTSRYRKHPL